MKTRNVTRTVYFSLALLALSASTFAYADADDPPGRPVRIGFLQGSVSLETAGTSD